MRQGNSASILMNMSLQGKKCGVRVWHPPGSCEQQSPAPLPAAAQQQPHVAVLSCPCHQSSAPTSTSPVPSKARVSVMATEACRPAQGARVTSQAGGAHRPPGPKGPSLRMVSCRVSGCGQSGLSVSGPSFVELGGNTVVEGCEQEGVMVRGEAVALLHEGARITNCRGPCMDLSDRAKVRGAQDDVVATCNWQAQLWC
jgi:hypothetical protein